MNTTRVETALFELTGATDKLEALGAKCFGRRPEGQQGFYETKFHGPDKVLFDITDHPWRGAAPLDAGEATDIKAPATAAS